jgi:type IV secretion system protein TrbL
MGASFSSGAMAAGSAAKEKAIGSPGAYAGSLLGLANAKLDQARGNSSAPTPPPEKPDKP